MPSGLSQYRRTNSARFCSYVVSRTIKQESGWWLPGAGAGWTVGGNGGLLLPGDKVSAGQDKRLPGVCCTTLCRQLTNTVLCTKKFLRRVEFTFRGLTTILFLRKNGLFIVEFFKLFF